MKPAIIPTLCGAALAVMAGAASSHFLSVRHMVELAEASQLPMPAVEQELAHPSAQEDTQALIAHIRQQNASLQGALTEQKTDLAQRTAKVAPQQGDLNQVLSELVALNRDLRNQVAETNRDLMELQFRVDTHSEQFRPLQVTEQTYDSMDEFDPSAIAVLPPLDP